MTSLLLMRSGIPFLELDSTATFYLQANGDITPDHAKKWQSSTVQYATKNRRELRTPETIAAKHPSQCVSYTNTAGTHVLDCLTEGTPMMLSFFGSKEAEQQVRAMLRSMQ